MPDCMHRHGGLLKCPAIEILLEAQVGSKHFKSRLSRFRTNFGVSLLFNDRLEFVDRSSSFESPSVVGVIAASPHALSQS